MAGFKKFRSGTLTALAGVLALGSLSPAATARPVEQDQDGSRRPVWSRGDENRAGPARGMQGRQWGQAQSESQRSASAPPMRARSETRVQSSPRSEAQDWRSARENRAGDTQRTYNTRGWQRGDENRSDADRRRWDSQRTVRTPTPDQRVGQQTQHYRVRDGWRSDRRDGSRYSGSSYGSTHRSWDRDWRRDNRYDWRSYRNSHRHYYQVGRYSSPYSYHRYNRVSIGFSLNSLFYGRNYWISDPWRYRLPDVYGPYRWVRYYDDVLLVDVYSGEVVDVIYDFFW